MINTLPATGAAALVNAWNDDYEGSGWSSQSVFRPKEAWAGVSLARAYDSSAPWHYRVLAQRQFMEYARNAQKAVHALKGNESTPHSPFAAKLQLTAFHTKCPNPAQVAIGHTVFLELKGAAESMSAYLEAQCDAEALIERGKRAPGPLKALVRQVAEALAARAILEEARRHDALAHVEHYRLHQAAQCSMRFPYLKDCVDAVVLFGDVLPGTDTLLLHSVTRRLLDTIRDRSAIFLMRLPEAPLTEFRPLFAAWAREIVHGLLPYMPMERGDDARVPMGDKKKTNKGEGQPAATGENPPGQEPDFQYSNEPKEDVFPEWLPPLDEPQPPVLADQPAAANTLQNALNAILNPKKPEDQKDPYEQAAEKEMKDAVNELRRAAANASAQTSNYGELRQDLLEQEMALRPFAEGLIEETQTEGQTVAFKMGDEEVGGNLMDRAIALSNDGESVDRLERESAPIAAALRGILYPSEREYTRVELIHTSGALDPRRLPVAEVCEAAYRRFQVRRDPSPRGKAVLLIAADGSGSLSDPQMRMCKLLMAAWLKSAGASNVQVMAALYHSETGSLYYNAPLVQWVYHPGKTPVFNPTEAVRAVAALPDCGTGAQSDALSLKFMLDEAVKIARGSRVYLTLISDCAWNRSFRVPGKSPEKEVAAVLEEFSTALNDRFHATLVALEDRNQTHITKVVNKIITVQEEELNDPEKVAVQIGAYVASCIRERRRPPRRRG